MLTLYYKPTCQFCRRVRAAAEDLGVTLELRDITESDAIAEELIGKGGKRQVPFLVDDAREVSMYESGDIISYLQNEYQQHSV